MWPHNRYFFGAMFLLTFLQKLIPHSINKYIDSCFCPKKSCMVGRQYNKKDATVCLFSWKLKPKNALCVVEPCFDYFPAIVYVHQTCLKRSHIPRLPTFDFRDTSWCQYKHCRAENIWFTICTSTTFFLGPLRDPARLPRLSRKFAALYLLVLVHVAGTPDGARQLPTKQNFRSTVSRLEIESREVVVRFSEWLHKTFLTVFMLFAWTTSQTGGKRFKYIHETETLTQQRQNWRQKQ